MERVISKEQAIDLFYELAKSGKVDKGVDGSGSMRYAVWLRLPATHDFYMKLLLPLDRIGSDFVGGDVSLDLSRDFNKRIACKFGEFELHDEESKRFFDIWKSKQGGQYIANGHHTNTLEEVLDLIKK